MMGSKIPRNLKEIKRIEKLPEGQIRKIQERRLKRMLFHAYNNIPYYHKILSEAKVVVNGKVNLKNFDKIPVLTKEIMRKEGKNMYSRDYKKRKSYKNYSSGSTGMPAVFIQDKYYDEWNIANKIYYKTFGGQDVGEKEFRLWGSERDLKGEKEKLSIRIRNKLYNRVDLNAFKMTPKEMEEYIKRINKEKPTWLECYVNSIHEFCKYIKKTKSKIHSPRGILTGAETLHPEIKKLIEEIFKCKVFNRYGSREVGGVACSCEKEEGLHVSVFNQYMEILNNNQKPCKPGEIGEIYITTLTNYSMPLIRYQIGDLAIPKKNKKCSCNRSLPLIKEVVGRTFDSFKTKEGRLIYGGYLTVLFFYADWVKKYQLIQKSYNSIIINAVLEDNVKPNKKSMNNINHEIKFVMGKDCKINWNFVKDIEPGKNGKYLYTICEV